jgi:hypothetical protein
VLRAAGSTAEAAPGGKEKVKVCEECTKEAIAIPQRDDKSEKKRLK